MPHPDFAIVTGAFSYTGRYVAQRLIARGARVRTLTRTPHAEDPLADHVETAPLDFSDPDGLNRSMQGAGVFYNTYWIRYARGRTTFDIAVENTGKLFEAAKRAGVGRIVHFSVTNPSSESGLPYFRGKAQVEDMLVAWYEVQPGQILAWKRALAEGAAGVFGKDQEKKSKNDAGLIPRLYQEIGQLKVERDFLAERSVP